MKQLDEKIKNKIIAVISALIPEARIYLYGSRARGDNGERSDIDIALDAGKPLNYMDVAEVKNMFSESNIMYFIDVVDLNAVNEDLRQQIMKDKVIWK